MEEQIAFGTASALPCYLEPILFEWPLGHSEAKYLDLSEKQMYLGSYNSPQFLPTDFAAEAWLV